MTQLHTTLPVHFSVPTSDLTRLALYFQLNGIPMSTLTPSVIAKMGLALLNSQLPIDYCPTTEEANYELSRLAINLATTIPLTTPPKSATLPDNIPIPTKEPANDAPIDALVSFEKFQAALREAATSPEPPPVTTQEE